MKTVSAISSQVAAGRVLDMGVDAIGALGRQGDGHGDQFSILRGDGPVLAALRSLLEVEERRRLAGCELDEAVGIREVVGILVTAEIFPGLACVMSRVLRDGIEGTAWRRAPRRLDAGRPGATRRATPHGVPPAIGRSPGPRGFSPRARGVGRIRRRPRPGLVVIGPPRRARGRATHNAASHRSRVQLGSCRRTCGNGSPRYPADTGVRRNSRTARRCRQRRTHRRRRRRGRPRASQVGLHTAHWHGPRPPASGNASDLPRTKYANSPGGFPRPIAKACSAAATNFNAPPRSRRSARGRSPGGGAPAAGRCPSGPRSAPRPASGSGVSCPPPPSPGWKTQTASGGFLVFLLPGGDRGLKIRGCRTRAGPGRRGCQTRASVGGRGGAGGDGRSGGVGQPLGAWGRPAEVDPVGTPSN